MPTLTPRQQEMLTFIVTSTRQRGYPPTVRDIAAAMGIKSPNGVMCHVKALLRKGMVHHEPGQARSLRAVGTEPLADVVRSILERYPNDPLAAKINQAISASQDQAPSLG